MPDHTPLTDQQLDEIEARANAATAGPWCTDSWEIYQGTEYEPGLSMWIGETCRGMTSPEQDRADAAFVAAARTDVPVLVETVRRLRATPPMVCINCETPVGWVDCPTGGWWAHETHPADGHDADPRPAQHGEEMADTLPAWLHRRFSGTAVTWDALDSDERAYWEHQAAAVRRAVARGGFKAAAMLATTEDLASADNPHAVLLKAAESYLSALHGSVARHDNLAANLGCAGCELRDKIRAALAVVPPAAAVEQPVEACGKCRRPFDAADTRWDGSARYRETPFCRRCIDVCHESTDAFHRCVICAPAAGVTGE